jgi:XTP/dITP diphosphohydrolase
MKSDGASLNLHKGKILLATRNKAKVKEYSKLLHGIPYAIVSLEDIGIAQDVEESGETFEENASIKAKTYASMSGLVAIADDSGLEVDALGGEPGVRSARYAGEGATDKRRIDCLISKMKNIPLEQRAARFRCVIAVATPGGEVKYCEGKCDGVITFEPKGENGFGYDPIFYLPDRKLTMAEISMEEKNKISHRGKAAAKARRLLQKWPG